MNTVHEAVFTFMKISRVIILRMTDISDKAVERIKHTFKFHTFFFLRKLCCLSDNIVKYGSVRQGTDFNILRGIRFACWITKTTNTHSEYVILIALPQYQCTLPVSWKIIQ
jgi:hypothetical protein